MSERTLPPIARTHYFSGESLLTADFICEQQYNMDMLALLNSSLRTWGIASGLEVGWQAGGQPPQVTVGAGMAIDALGRQIVLSNAEVLKLEGVPANSTVYLTIRYHEVYADYSVESGVPGYKRIVQQPLLDYSRTLDEPGINILLAVVSVSSQGGIDALSYKMGTAERRYVGSRLGLLELVTPGSGIDTSADAATSSASAVPLADIQLKALKEDDGPADYLQVQAYRSHFSGMLSTQGNLGVGVPQPQANLQVARITTKGVGMLTTRGPLLTFQLPIYPRLQPGDVVIPELPVNAAPTVPRQAVIKSATADGRSYQLAQAFLEDLLLPCRFSYVRMTLARFSAGDVGDLFLIEGDGTVGLGVQAAMQSGTPGPSALKITADRKVGIALDTHATPTVALDVNGDVVCSGLLRAQSFEGNGAKLQNLPILSYWTKQNVSSTYSNIFYTDGNVGVQMTNPPASLSVGTGRSFIGDGTLSADASDSTHATLIGNQTIFKSQLSLGDSIVLGKLMQQWRQIRTIIDDHQLELVEQFPSIIEQSPFLYAASDSPSVPGGANLLSPPPSGPKLLTPIPASATKAQEPSPGTGLISSNGSMIIGDDKTQFTKELKPGDWLVIEKFEPKTTPGNQDQWLIAKVVDDHTVQVVNNSGAPIPANISAYMVRQSLIGAFQCNADGAASPVPAMLLISNGADKPPEIANTVAINLTLDQTDRNYALQVKGDVNFSGGGTFNDLVTDTLTVKQWANIVGAGDQGTVLVAGSTAHPALLSVMQANVVIGASGGGSLLEIGGDAHATGNVSADAQLSGQSLSVGPPGAPHAVIDASGGVSLFGQGVMIKSGTFNIGNIAPQQSLITWFQTQQDAPTDGFVVATFGPLFPNNNTPYFAGWMTCATPSGTYYATGGTTSYRYGSTTWNNAMLSSLCAPVQKGQSWTLTIQLGACVNCVLYVNIFWVPLGVGGPTSLAASSPTPMAENAVPYQGSASLSVIQQGDGGQP